MDASLGESGRAARGDLRRKYEGRPRTAAVVPFRHQDVLDLISDPRERNELARQLQQGSRQGGACAYSISMVATVNSKNHRKFLYRDRTNVLKSTYELTVFFLQKKTVFWSSWKGCVNSARMRSKRLPHRALLHCIAGYVVLVPRVCDTISF